MPSKASLRSTLHKLAGDFSLAVLQAIRGARLEDLLADGPAAPRRSPPRPPRPRRSSLRAVAASAPVPDPLQSNLGLVVAALQAGPMKAPEIGRFLKLGPRELAAVLKEGGRAKKVVRKGTKYFAA